MKFADVDFEGSFLGILFLLSSSYILSTSTSVGFVEA